MKSGHLQLARAKSFPGRLSSADFPYFEPIPEWKRLSKTKNKHDMYERGRMMKIVSRLVIFFLINCVYILAGAWVFMKLEGPSDQTRKMQLYRQFVNDYHWRNVSRAKKEELIRVYKTECHLNTTEPWTFHHSIHLTYSIITTIGFGEIAPKTVAGKIITVVYAIIGIFIFVLSLASLRFLVTLAINKIILLITNHRTNRPKTRMIKVTIVLALICFLWITTSFFTFKPDEPMSWYYSWYNIFIAVTTIGFGDRVVLDDFHNFIEEHDTFVPKEILQAIYMINIILILVLFSSLFEQIKQENVEEVSKRISHYINTFNQTHSKYVLVGPILSAPGSMITPGFSRREMWLPSIDEAEGTEEGVETESETDVCEIQSNPKAVAAATRSKTDQDLHTRAREIRAYSKQSLTRSRTMS